MKYTKYTPEENLKLGRIWGRGHTGKHYTDVFVHSDPE